MKAIVDRLRLIPIIETSTLDSMKTPQIKEASVETGRYTGQGHYHAFSSLSLFKAGLDATANYPSDAGELSAPTPASDPVR